MKTIFLKLQKQQQSPNTLLCVDFDGTLFTASLDIFKAPYYNRKTSILLEKYSIPAIVVTGRSVWGKKSEIETRLLGFDPPDMIITGAGTIIFYRDGQGHLIKDHSWDAVMRQSVIVWNNHEKETWNRRKINEKIQSVFKDSHVQYSVPSLVKNNYLVRIKVTSVPMKKLNAIKQNIERLCISGLKVVYTEKLLHKNTLQMFSGDILILPETAGKENALLYILKKIKSVHTYPIHVFSFADATIDVSFLTLKNTEHWTFSAFGVHMTPLAKKLLEEKKLNSHSVQIVPEEGPKVIFDTLHSKIELKDPKIPLSPAQNSKQRKLIRIVEPILDTIIDKNKTPNDISLQGLYQLKKSIDLIYGNNPVSNKDRLQALYLYLLGITADLFDGIRARRSSFIDTNGQLVDGYCDRSKEFYQVYKRAQIRMNADQEKGFQTFLTAISCILPSIARAQSEINGIIVKEQDDKGGSMFARTKKLFWAFICDMLGMHKQSFGIDQKNYAANIATFENRLPSGNPAKPDLQSMQIENLSAFQKKALERWILYINLLQEEYSLVKKCLKKSPYEQAFTAGFAIKIMHYLSIDTAALRKQLGFQPFHFSMHDLI